MAKSKAEKAKAKYEKAKETSEPGEGKRFAALSGSLGAKGAENPDALAAWIGAKKYSRPVMQKMAAAGRKGS
jgi:hypothetical protein